MRSHVNNDESLKKIYNRLSCIEGHTRGVKTMLTENFPCPEILVQLAAVRETIERVSRLILDKHLSECLARAAQEGDINKEIEELKAAIDKFLP
ncbi:metal-sensing transcriptional repressor [cyanobacterium endosymbiont of Epithemia clementina EcSB]|uniref:metal-sensing transcriptional repressor n=1 Tax=cyanobacterium endosymbiont of Epithemia clementina EcSB TaxID=3034674 RepID=UPI00386CBCBF